MTQIIRIKNNTQSDNSWVGQTIIAGEYYEIGSSEHGLWKTDLEVFNAIADEDLIVNNGEEDLPPILGWKWLDGEVIPLSRNLEGKVAVHASAKPEPPGVLTYAVWTGAGDDLTNTTTNNIGEGETLHFDVDANDTEIVKDIKFDPRHGRIWIHEAYLKFENGGWDDYLTADVVAPATQLQQSVDLDYIVEDGWLKYATGSPGGTHGLAGTPILVPRYLELDGDWNYNTVTESLTPNFAGTGQFKITTIERNITRYINKIPVYGTSSTYVVLTSEETAELPVDLGYFLRVRAINNSGTSWKLTAIMELYRERTIYT